MFWKRDDIDWSSPCPQLLGTKINSDVTVDFSKQVGVYILYQGEKIVYVGKAAKDTLADRLKHHTRDRLRARWDCFSWFGLKDVDDKGRLLRIKKPIVVSPHFLATTLEAVLIESLEPVQNRRRGDKIESLEYIQHPDPLLAKRDREKILLGLLRGSNS